MSHRNWIVIMSSFEDATPTHFYILDFLGYRHTVRMLPNSFRISKCKKSNTSQVFQFPNAHLFHRCSPVNRVCHDGKGDCTLIKRQPWKQGSTSYRSSSTGGWKFLVQCKGLFGYKFKSILDPSGFGTGSAWFWSLTICLAKKPVRIAHISGRIAPVLGWQIVAICPTNP